MSKRILVIEDEPLIALEIADCLTDAGFEVTGPASSVAKALKLISDPGCDFAILDVNLGKENSETVALALKTHDIPFVVLSGNSREYLPSGFAEAPIISKPVEPSKLINFVRTAWSTTKGSQ